MNKLLPQPLNIKKANKLFVITMLLFCLLPILINCFALVPLYSSLSANAAFSDTALPVIIKYVQDFFDLTAFSVSYALIIFSVLLLSKKHARKVVLIYTLTFFVKIPIRLIMNIPLYGTLGSASEITLDLLYMGFYFFLEMLQLLIVYFFATTDTNKHLRKMAFAKRSRGKHKKQVQSDEGFFVLPLSSFLSTANPLQRSALKMSAFVCGIKIFTRILNDIVVGAPQSWGEVLVMVVYYLSDLLYGVVAYIIALLVFNIVYERLKLKPDDNEKNENNEKTDKDEALSVLDD